MTLGTAAVGTVQLGIFDLGGQVAVIKAGGDWEMLALNAMDDEVFATPAPLDRRLYLRTRSALYCFGN